MSRRPRALPGRPKPKPWPRLERAVAIHRQGKLAAAKAEYEAMSIERPRNPYLLYFQALLAYQERRMLRAVDLMEQAIAVEPRLVPGYYNLGCFLMEQGHSERAAEMFREALRRDPNLSEARTNLGNALLDQGRVEDAIACYGAVAAQKPRSPEARYNRSIAMLLTGRYEEGWQEYETRWDMPLWLPEHGREDLAGQQWDGTPLDGKRLLVAAEQGFGDMLMMLRYGPTLTERFGARLIWEVQPALKELIRANVPAEQPVIARGEPIPEYDAWITVMSLPARCGTTLETIPRGCEPYIAPVPGDRAQLADDGGAFRIGFTWSGSPMHRNDIRRSTPLHIWAPLFEIPGTAWYSLNVGAKPWEAKCITQPNVYLIEGQLQGWQDTAAIVDQLDMVICVDTGLAHLAGAMGKPTWIWLAASPDFRWMLGREDSPWYPLVRLFRQKRAREWGPVVDSAKLALEDAIYQIREREAVCRSV